MERDALKKISKSLSYVLRHQPDTIGIELQPGGWVAVEDLLAGFARTGKQLPIDQLMRIVAESDKQRFEFNEDQSLIRARQGHSADVDLEYEPTPPPGVLYHGTATKNLDSILANGLVKGGRHHVHMSTNRQTMIQVGMRHGKPALIQIDAARMHADGFEFFVTGNHVWLTDHVPAKYLSVVRDDT